MPFDIDVAFKTVKILKDYVVANEDTVNGESRPVKYDVLFKSLDDGTGFYVYGTQTFDVKDKIKAFGAKWNMDKRRWEFMGARFDEDTV